LPPKAAPKKNLSALKRARQAEKRRLRNRAMKTAIKTITRKVETAVAKKDKDVARNTLREAVKLISKAASKGLLHRNTASRKISRLSKITDTFLRSEAA
jgi:small subunit ribosomal protein S20